jgi:FKBP-type peptidyl-prolyl cis-trans isomerase
LEESVKKTRNRIINSLITLLTGFIMFSMANAASPEENKIAGEKFLAENQQKPDIKVTASGLQYQVLTEGNGKTPSATDNVTVHYRGTTINGAEFDSSYSRGAPATFPLNGVIAGWTEGVQLMKEGAKYRFYIPSQLAYGERGAGRQIGPNSALIFDVELIKVN